MPPHTHSLRMILWWTAIEWELSQCTWHTVKWTLTLSLLFHFRILRFLTCSCLILFCSLFLALALFLSHSFRFRLFLSFAPDFSLFLSFALYLSIFPYTPLCRFRPLPLHSVGKIDTGIVIWERNNRKTRTITIIVGLLLLFWTKVVYNSSIV